MKNAIKATIQTAVKNESIAIALVAIAIAAYVKITLMIVLWGAEYGQLIQEHFGLTDLAVTIGTFCTWAVMSPSQAKVYSTFFNSNVGKEKERIFVGALSAIGLALIVISTTYAQTMMFFAPINLVITYAAYRINGAD